MRLPDGPSRQVCTSVAAGDVPARVTFMLGSSRERPELKTTTKAGAPQAAQIEPAKKEYMPGAALPIAPSIPTAPVTPAIVDRLRPSWATRA